MALISLPKLALSLIALYLARRIYWEATTGATRRAFANQHGCLPAKPKPWVWDPLIGFDWVLSNFNAFQHHRLLECFSRMLADNNAHTLTLSFLGSKIYVTDEPENVKAMLATDFSSWSIGRDRIAMTDSFIGKGIFTTEGAAWKHSRDMLRPCFERSQVADMSIMERHTNQFIERIPKDGATVDLQPLFAFLTLDIATEFLFGHSTHSLDPAQSHEDVKEFIAAFDYCCNPFTKENNKWGWIGTLLPDKKRKKCAKIIQDFAGNLVEKELKARSSESSEQRRRVFLDELMQESDNRDVIRCELLHILLAGRDTTAALLSNLFFEVARHPDIIARLRQEIAEYVGDGAPTYQQLKDMKYLRAVLNESQRMLPVIPLNSREALQDTVMPRGGGPTGSAPIFVPKGGNIVFDIYAMHRRTDVYGPDAEAFNPSRWLENEHPSAPLRPGWGYLPFSGGPRICIGQQFALTEAGYVVVRLLQAFQEVETRDHEPWREKLTLICTGLGGCKLGLKV